MTGNPWWNSLPFWWAVFYIIFVGINVIGIEATMRFTVTITVLSIAVLVFFFIAAIFSGKLDFDLWTNIAKDGGEIPGGGGLVAAVRLQRDLQVPTVRDLVLPRDRGSARSPRRSRWTRRRDVPKGSVWAMHTLADRGDPDAGSSTPALPGGAFLYGQSGFPLLDGFYAIFGKGSAVELLGADRS